jgi:hypothetical protein
VCERNRPTIRRIGKQRVSTITLVPRHDLPPKIKPAAIQLAFITPLNPETLLVADMGNDVLWSVNVSTGLMGTLKNSARGNAEVVVGLAGKGYEDGSADVARLNTPTGLLRADDGTILVAEGFGQRIRALKSKE